MPGRQAHIPRIAVPRGLLQDHSGEQRVTNIELFFDLVYVFAVTQMSHHLLAGPDLEGAVQTALLLALVWWAWVYTTWATNWLDARQIPVRLMLIVLMVVSLVPSAALPGAFGSRGLIVACAYVPMPVGPVCVRRHRGARAAGRPDLRAGHGVVGGQRLRVDHRLFRGRPCPGAGVARRARGRPAQRPGRLLYPGMGRTTGEEWTIAAATSPSGARPSSSSSWVSRSS
jgi:Bacterial low temperature requirement A protein (LtrA)